MTSDKFVSIQGLIIKSLHVFFFRETVTKYFFWLLSSQVSSDTLSPSRFPMPNVTILMSEFETQRLPVEFYEGQTFRSYDDAYYLFVKDTVYNENVDCFVSALEEWWQRNNGKCSISDFILINQLQPCKCFSSCTVFRNSFTKETLFQVMLVPEWKSRPEICTSMKGSVSNPLIRNMMHDF